MCRIPTAANLPDGFGYGQMRSRIGDLLRWMRRRQQISIIEAEFNLSGSAGGNLIGHPEVSPVDARGEQTDGVEGPQPGQAGGRS